MLACQNSHLSVGLLGGSFNPAHEGHLHISLDAYKRLGLDHVWWLVSPQNPLKPKKDMAPYEERFESALHLSGGYPFLKTTDIERTFGTTYSIDTVKRLKQAFPNIRFVWLMGADNLIDFHRWRNWRELFQQVPVAVFDREPYKLPALAGQTASFFRKDRMQQHHAKALVKSMPPKWSFIRIQTHPQSSTAIRNQ